MNTNASSPCHPTLIRRTFASSVFGNQSGQTLPLVALFMTVLLGIAGIVTDVGHVYVVQDQLQNSANAAALAAAGYVYTSNTAAVNTTTQADQYGSTGQVNSSSYATSAPLVQAVCLNMLMPKGNSCGPSSVANAVRVTESASVNTFFMAIFGFRHLSVSATAMASMLGGEAQPWNIAIVLDATGSMNFADPNCGAGMTEFTCATTAIQGMLGAASPCAPGYATCPTSNANLHIGLFSFPGISTNTVANDTTSCTTPGFMVYTLPKPTDTSYTPLSYKEGGTTWTGTYEIVPFTSDYYSSTAANNLNTSSDLVKAVTGCMSPISQGNNATGGLQGAPDSTNGGVTYFASPIYAAQDALLAQQAANPGTNNAIILLSDGQANMPSQATDFPSEQSATLAPGYSGYTTPGSNGLGIYPDFNDECQQAIQAAQDAAAAGTRVYAVSYGAEAQGCSYTVGTHGSLGSFGTDNTTVATGINASFTAANITPCVTMENIASNMNYFYSDFNQSDAGTGPDRNCIDNSHPVTALSDILLSILSDFLRPRLLPISAPYQVVSNQ